MLPRKPKALRHLLRRFRKTSNGSTAIEFAMLIVPFLMITMGTLEIALIHLSRSSMAHSIELTTRPIMTGTAQCNLTADDFIDDLCASVTFANGNCKANTKVVMERLNSFTASASSVNGQDFNNIQNKMTNGSTNDIMLLRTYHRWNVMFPLLDDALGGGNGELILETNLAFKNEPYNASSGCTPPPPPTP